MEVCALASGSSGNCFYVGDSRGGVLIDAGISCKQICARLSEKGIDVDSIRGVFLTHEHSDHIKGVDVFARNFGVPIFAPANVLRSKFICGNGDLLNVIKIGKMDFLNFEIESFSKSHKAVDPVSFSVSKSGKKVSVITDLGEVNEKVCSEISKSDFLFLESNHDLEMLENGKYPYFLKKWVSGRDGHLSNFDAANCVLENCGAKLKNVVLSHLSENNNSVEVALKTWGEVFRGKENFDLHVSTRDLGEVFRV